PNDASKVRRAKNKPAGGDGCEKQMSQRPLAGRSHERRSQANGVIIMGRRYRVSTVLSVFSFVTVTLPAGSSRTVFDSRLTLPFESVCVVVFSATVRSQATRPIGRVRANATNIEQDEMRFIMAGTPDLRNNILG